MTTLHLDTFEIEPGPDDEHVTLIFRSDSGESQAVALKRTQLPALVARLARETGPGQATPIDKDSLRTGKEYSVQAFYVQRPMPDDGARLLVLVVHFEDRVVTIPLELSPPDVQHMVTQLK